MRRPRKDAVVDSRSEPPLTAELIITQLGTAASVRSKLPSTLTEGSAGMDILETDVLIIGGGFARCWAALRAADLKATVTLVDKAHVSRSGASTMSGGITTCPLDSDDLEPWAEEFIVRGSYMCDQRWTYQLLEGQRERIKDYVRWNV